MQLQPSLRAGSLLFMARQHVNEGFRVGVWPTPWGPMGGLLGPEGLLRLTCPGPTGDDLREMLLWQYPGSVSNDDALAPTAELCRSVIRGDSVDLAAVACDLGPMPPFARSVLEAVREISRGQALSCSHLAEKMNQRGKAVQVATAVNSNPLPLVIPCHRVAGISRPPADRPELGEFRKKLLAIEQLTLRIAGGT